MKQYQTKIIQFINNTLSQPLNNLNRVPQMLEEEHLPLLLEKYYQGDYKHKWVIFQILEQMGAKAKGAIPKLYEMFNESYKGTSKKDFGRSVKDLELLDHCDEIMKLINKLQDS